MKFEIGEVVIIIEINDYFTKNYGVYSGMECTIIKPMITDGGEFGYEVDVGDCKTPEGGNWHTPEWNLKKKRPPFEKGDWEECAWNPYKQKINEPIAA